MGNNEANEIVLPLTNEAFRRERKRGTRNVLAVWMYDDWTFRFRDEMVQVG
jgi:hypothetical protein